MTSLSRLRSVKGFSFRLSGKINLETGGKKSTFDAFILSAVSH